MAEGTGDGFDGCWVLCKKGEGRLNNSLEGVFLDILITAFINRNSLR
jgi:hypothetical protein